MSSGARCSGKSTYDTMTWTDYFDPCLDLSICKVYMVANLGQSPYTFNAEVGWVLLPRPHQYAEVEVGYGRARDIGCPFQLGRHSTCSRGGTG